MNKKSLIILFFLSFYTVLTYSMNYNLYTGEYEYRPTPQQTEDARKGCDALQDIIENGSREEVLSKRCLAIGSISGGLAATFGCIALCTGGVGIGTAAVTGGIAIVGCTCSYCTSKETYTNTCRQCSEAMCCGYKCCASPEEQRSLVRSQPGMH